MKIRTNLSLLSVSFVLLILAIAGLTLYTFSLTGAQREKRTNADEIIKSTFELNIITYDYLMHHEERMQKQWLQKYDSLCNLLERMKKEETNPSSLPLLESIATDHGTFGMLFSKLQNNVAKRTQLIAGNRPQPEINLSLALEESLTIQASMGALRVMAEAFKLQAITEQQITLVQEKYKQTLLFSILAFAVFATFTSVLSIRAITRPIKELIKGAGIVGEGDLEHRIEIKAKSEIGELAVAFNQMTEKRRLAGEQLLDRTYDLDERVKELNCINQASILMADQSLSLDEIFSGIVNLIPSSWQYPDITCARLVFNGQRFQTEKFEKSGWKLASDIIASSKAAGTLEVYYMQEKPPEYEGVFLKEERDLIDNLTRAMGLFIERRRAEDEIRELNEELEQRVFERTAQLELKSNLLESINKVFRETLMCDTDEEVARICLAVAEKLTGSKFGYIGEVNKAGRFDTIAMSNPGWDACKMPQSDATVLINDMELVSFWGRAIKEGRTQIVNDPAADPDSGGIPEGHPPITSFIGVPLKLGENITGLIALANKEAGYSEADRQNLEALSIAFSEALNRTRALMAIRGLNKSLNGKTIELEAANKELEAFSYSVSHDLRAPLRSIDGFSHALLEDYREKLDEQGKDYLQRVRAASQRMADLIDDMLTLSRITRSEMKREKVDLSALVQSVAGELRENQPDRNVEFIIQEGLVADGDVTLLRLVIENLLGNAWKFTSKHSNAKIEFGVKEHDGQPAYFVQDNGAGFDMAYADKLFSAFQRLHKVTEFPGTGVGLASAKRIISRHGGTIWAEGEVEKGATFYFNVNERRTNQ